MNNDIQGAIRAIHAINSQMWEEDIRELLAALSCKIAKNMNAHMRSHEVAVESLDDLYCYLEDINK
jgi:hypothetical protein